MKERTSRRGCGEYAQRRLTIISAGPAKAGHYVPRLLALIAIATGLAAWAFYLQHDLVLSHYDAKAHLVVSRRIIDSLTPGWRQIGAVWLPLPHLIQMLPTQVDALYRTGAFGSLLSIGCLAATVWACARTVLTLTGSAAGALTAGGLLVLNPNLLYLFATPMTEPLLIAACALAVLWTIEWMQDGPTAPVPWRLSATLFAAAWTRYEAWPVIAGLCACALAARWRPIGYAAWPAAAVVVFLLNSRASIGQWFVTGGFYVPDPMYDGRPITDAIGVWWGTHQLSGYVTETVALATAAALAWRAVRRRDWTWLVPVTLLAAGALPFYAMFEGHPYRIRYMVPMVAACALLCGIAVGMWRPAKWRPTAPEERRPATRRPGLYGPASLATVLLVASVIESPTWAQRTPLLEEAKWDVPASLNRRAVRVCLARDYDGSLVLASMGSLAHLMQELSHDGFAIADFIHEGNGSVWTLAMETGPAPHAGWMLVEEVSEGGDALAARIRGDAAFTAGMTRVCEGGGVGLYRRTLAGPQ